MWVRPPPGARLTTKGEMHSMQSSNPVLNRSFKNPGYAAVDPNKLEDLYDELQAINNTLDQISSEVREPQKKKTTVLEGIMLGLSVVSLVGGVSGLAKQIKAAKDFNDSIGATKEAVKQSKNVQKLAKTAKPIPLDKPNVLHHCDNPPCVNPEHLFVGTQADNIKDMVAKGRNVSPQALKTHCPSGHEYNKINTRIKSNNHRICKVCDRNRKKETSACKRNGVYI